MNPSIAPIDFVKDIKVASSIWMKRSNLFPAFYGWAVGYGSFTCSYPGCAIGCARGYSCLALSEPAVLDIMKMCIKISLKSRGN